MEDNVRRKRRDLIQNIAIVALSLSAVLLFAQSQIYNLLSDQSVLTDRLVGTAAGDTAVEATLIAPVRVVVTGVYDRYGAILTTDAESFSDLGLLLKEALGAAGTLTVCQEAEFVSALGTSSVYYDFLSPLPLSILSELVGGGGEGIAGNTQIRQLALSPGGSSVYLYAWDGGATYYVCQVPPLSVEDLETVVNNCTFGVAAFAYDEVSLNERYGQIAPHSLLLAELPVLPVLSASNPLTSSDQVLTALGFNPSTKNRYTDAGGTEIIRETDRSLQIGSGGTVVYEGGTDPVVTIQAEGDLPTPLEAAVGATSLLRTLLGDLSGEAALYLESIRFSEETTVLRFGYHVSGTPIRFSDGAAAAEVTLSGTTVSHLSLRVRQYVASGEESLLLPLRQALAIAADTHQGAELFIGYADTGAAVSAQWMAG